MATSRKPEAWSPSSWRAYPALHQPEWPDSDRAEAARSRLKGLPPLVFTGEARHQGFPGVVHGGIISTLLDETMGRTALFERAWVMTGRLEVRYRNPAPTGEPLTVLAWATRLRSRSVETRGEVRRADGELLAEGTGLFLKVPEQVKQQAQEAHPEFREYFEAGMPRGEG